MKKISILLVVFTMGIISNANTQVINHDVQSVNLQTSKEKAFAFISNPKNLNKWTGAFKEADKKTALLVTSRGELKIDLKTKINKKLGTIDWYMTMPDGSVGVAYSRVTTGPNGKAIYSFTLIAPPVPLEQVEGALAAQIGQLKEELKNLQEILSE
tara:strand:- start:2133 stop:2600 length:468 start_codon:yes stop_codon:yes gene_type:complete